MIDVVYIGLPRFKVQTLENHSLLFEKLKEHFQINIIDFTTELPRENCVFNPMDVSVRGNLQVWDFIEAARQTTNNIILKIRTDVLFSPSSIDVIISEIKKVQDNKTDISFLGFYLKKYYNQKYAIEPVSSRVLDFIIVANKQKMVGEGNIKKALLSKNIHQGHDAFPLIISNKDNTYNVHCQIVLIRKEYIKVDNWEFDAYKDYFLVRKFKQVKNILEYINNSSQQFKDL